MLEFPPFRLDRRAGLLWKDGRPVPLRPKTWALLCYLTDHPGLLVTKDELSLAVWKEPAVSDDAISRTLGELRRALGDDARTPSIVQTVHCRGFRFIAALERPAPRVPPAEEGGGLQPAAVAAGTQRAAAADAEAPAGAPIERWMGSEVPALHTAWKDLVVLRDALEVTLRSVARGGEGALATLAERLDSLNDHTWSFAARVASLRRALPPPLSGTTRPEPS